MDLFHSILRFLGSNWNPVLTVAALCISVFDASLHLRSHLRERENLRARQICAADTPSLAFHVERSGTSDSCVIFPLLVENTSRTPMTIAEIELVGKRRTRARAARFNASDGAAGRLRLVNPQQRKGLVLDLDQQNLALTPRLDGNDSKDGYLVFFGLPVPESGSRSYTLLLRAGPVRRRLRVRVDALSPELTAKAE